MTLPGKTIHLIAGGRSIEVRIRETAKRWYLSFRNYAPLREEIKCMKGAAFQRKTAEWAISKCPRNRIQLELLQNQEPRELARYTASLPWIKPKRSLWDHQVQMLGFLCGRRRCLLAAEMGTGKTLATIEAMEWAAGRGFTEWLYVAPAKVLAAIELELDKWAATVRPRLCSYAKLARTLAEWEGPAPHGVVFDESSRIKNPGAKRTLAAQHLADAIREEHDGFVFCLSGRPAPKNPTDWWAQAEVTCPGFLRESSRARLEKRMAVIKPLDLGDRVVPQIVGWREDEVELLGRRLDGLVQVHYASDCQELPEMHVERVALPVSKETRRLARLIADSSVTGADALNRLRQLSDGFQYAKVGARIEVDVPKDPALRDILARNETVGRIVVFAGFRASVERCVEICQDEGWEVVRCDGRGWWPRNYRDLLREMDAKTSTDTGKIAFVAHPQSGGMGLTLTAARTAVYWSNDFNNESRMQSLKRIHRAGQTRGCRVYDLCHLATDGLVLDNLARKRELEDITLDEIKGVL